MERDIEKHVLIEIWKRPDGRIEKVFSRNPKKEVTEFYSYNCVPCSVRDLSGEFGLYKHMESCEHKQKLSNTDMPQASDSLTVNSSISIPTPCDSEDPQSPDNEEITSNCDLDQELLYSELSNSVLSHSIMLASINDEIIMAQLSGILNKIRQSITKNTSLPFVKSVESARSSRSDNGKFAKSNTEESSMTAVLGSTHSSYKSSSETAQQEKCSDLSDKFKIRLENAKIAHEIKYELFAKCPDKHPKYKEEWELHWSEKYNKLIAEGKDANKHNYKPEWKIFWISRMKQLKYEDFEEDRRKIYEELSMTKPTGFKEELKRSVLLPLRSRSRSEFSYHDEMVEKHLKHDEKYARSRIERSKADESTNISKVCSNILAIGFELGNDASKVVELMEKAQALERVDKKSEILLKNKNDFNLLSTIKQKIDGLLAARTFERSRINFVENVSTNLEMLLKKESNNHLTNYSEVDDNERLHSIRYLEKLQKRNVSKGARMHNDKEKLKVAREKLLLWGNSENSEGQSSSFKKLKIKSEPNSNCNIRQQQLMNIEVEGRKISLLLTAMVPVKTADYGYILGRIILNTGSSTNTISMSFAQQIFPDRYIREATIVMVKLKLPDRSYRRIIECLVVPYITKMSPSDSFDFRNFSTIIVEPENLADPDFNTVRDIDIAFNCKESSNCLQKQIIEDLINGMFMMGTPFGKCVGGNFLEDEFPE